VDAYCITVVSRSAPQRIRASAQCSAQNEFRSASASAPCRKQLVKMEVCICIRQPITTGTGRLVASRARSHEKGRERKPNPSRPDPYG
jgi:hypothetical protein